MGAAAESDYGPAARSGKQFHLATDALLSSSAFGEFESDPPIDSAALRRYAVFTMNAKALLTTTGLALLLGLGLGTGSGCSSASSQARKADQKIRWDERIGTYTYDQAFAELGKPSVLTESNEGRTAEWVLRRSPQMSFGFGVGGGSYGSHSGMGVGVGSSVSPPPSGEYLQLPFDPAGKLTGWSRVKY